MGIYRIVDVTYTHDPEYERLDEEFDDFNLFIREIAIMVRDGITIYEAQIFNNGTIVVVIVCPENMIKGE